MPVIALKARCNVVAVGQFRHAFDRHAIVVVKPAEVIEAQVTGQRSRLMGNTFLQISIRNDAVNAVIANSKIGRVECCAVKLLSDREADRISRALT